MATTLLVANGFITDITEAETGIIRDGFIFPFSNEPSVLTQNFISSGGATVGGEAVVDHFGGIYYDDLVASGGGIAGGSATQFSDNLNIDDFVANGGGVGGGAAEIDSLKSHTFVGSGGAVVGGVADKVGSYNALQRTILFTCT